MKKVLIILIVIILAGAGGAFYFLTQNQEKTPVAFDYDPGDYFVTDIQGSRSLLKTDIIIHMQDDAKQEEYIENNHRIRDAIIFILRSKTEEQLKAADIEQKLNAEITKKLGVEFESEDFLKIYFNEFVIQ